MELACSLTWGASLGTPTFRYRPPIVQPITQSPFRRHGPPSLVPTNKRATSPKEQLPVTRCTQSPGAGEGDSHPPESAPKPPTPIEDGDVISLPGALEVKKRAVELFSGLMGLAGDKVQFVFKPTKDHGTDVGIRCRLDWKKSLPLGKGSSFYTAHSYQGRTFISNVEAIKESFLHSMTVKLILMGFFWPFLNQTAAVKLLQGESKARLTLLLVLLLVMAISFILAKRSSHKT